jgi:hypothetical protein
MAQQEKPLADDLIQSVHELRGELHHALEKVQHSHYDALEIVQEWRQKQIESIEQRYVT